MTFIDNLIEKQESHIFYRVQFWFLKMNKKESFNNLFLKYNFFEYVKLLNVNSFNICFAPVWNNTSNLIRPNFRE